MPAKKLVILSLSIAFTLLLAPHVFADTLFFEDFEADLSQWNNGHGAIVNDPLESDYALNFTQLNSGGDIFTTQAFNGASNDYTLSFDYLGRPELGGIPDNLGGFIGYKTDSKLEWLGGTGGGYPDLLPDTGQWEHVEISFSEASSVNLMVQDWKGHGYLGTPGNIPGDAYFDNIRLSTLGGGNGVKEYDTALILAEFDDYTGNDSADNPPHPDSSEFVALGNRLNDYFQDISYGQVGLNTQVFDNDGDWYGLDNNEADYVGNEGALVEESKVEAENAGVNLDDFDINMVVHSGRNAPVGSLISQAFPSSNDVMVSEFHGTNVVDGQLMWDTSTNLGTYAHEIGHILGGLEGDVVLPDLYRMGNMQGDSDNGMYDLMASGNKNDSGQTPPQMSSFTKELLGWLQYEDFTLGSDPLEFQLNSLDSLVAGSYVPKVNIDGEKFYVLEARSDEDLWDASIPQSGFVMYEVDTNGESEPLEQMGDLVRYNWGIDLAAVLSPYDPSVESVFFDMVNGTRTTLLSPLDDEMVRVSVERELPDERLVGVVMEGSNRVFSEVESLYPAFEPFDFSLPDLDLHLYTDDGRHVGMNYDTGIYEFGVFDALASGDRLSGSEWIFLPADFTGYHFMISSFDTNQFLQKVSGAWDITGGVDEYQLFGAFNDPLTNQLFKGSYISRSINAGDNPAWFLDYSQNEDGSYNINIDNPTVPEPSTLLLVGLGNLILFGTRAFNKKRKVYKKSC